MPDPDERPQKDLRLLIKNPSKPGAPDFALDVDGNATILAVKQKLEAVYEGRPKPEKQTLIYAGKVLRDEAVLLKSVFNTDAEPPLRQTLHLVVKDSPASPAPSPDSATASSSAQVPDAPRSSAQRPATEATSTGQTPGVQGIHLPTHPVFQAGFANSWSAAQPDPTILAAYNAALEALRNRPNFPAQAAPSPRPANGAIPQPGPQLAGQFGQPGILPPFSIAPNMVLPPAMQQAAGRQPEGGSPSTSAAASSSALPAASGAGSSPRLPQLYAPALAYVPVNLVQQNPQNAQQPPPPAAAPASSSAPQAVPLHPGGPGGQPPQQQLFPYPPFAPMLPMMMPFGFNPYAQQMFAGNQPPQGGAFQPLGHHPMGALPPEAGQPQPAQAFQGMPQPPPGGLPGFVVQNLRLGQPRVRVRLIRVNIKLFLQILILTLIVYQNTSHARFMKLVGGGLAVYILWPMMNRNNVVQRQIRRFLNPQAGPAPAAGQEGMQNGNNNNNGQAPAERPVGGIFHEIQALLVGFFTSLLPGFNMNAEDAAAIAQVQQMAFQEQQANREHID